MGTPKWTYSNPSSGLLHTTQSKPAFSSVFLSKWVETDPFSSSGFWAILDPFFLSDHTSHPLANPVALASKHTQILTLCHELHCYSADPSHRIPCHIYCTNILFGLSASVKMRSRSCHFSSSKSPVASQISVQKPTIPFVVQRPLPVWSRLLSLPCPLNSSHTGFLAQAPITHQEDSCSVFVPVIPFAWNSLVQTSMWFTPSCLYSKFSSAVRPFPDHPNENCNPPSHRMSSPCFIFLHYTYYQLYILICILFVSPLIDTPKLYAPAIICFCLFYSHP